MDKKESIRFASEIASHVAADALYAPYPENMHGNTAVSYVIRCLDRALLLKERTGAEYVEKLAANARELDPAEISNNPYLKAVRFSQARCGDFLLTHCAYERGELLQYAMPDLSAEIVIPALGFYPEKVTFPTIYEGNMPWMSVCPSEISSMEKPIRRTWGRVLTLGCGLGYYPFMISQKPEVSHVTIIERQPEVIRLFETHILPHFAHPEKISIVQADAFEYVDQMEDNAFDMCFADIWEGPSDGANAYVLLKEMERRFPSTEFMYWIEDAIRWWLIDEYDT